MSHYFNRNLFTTGLHLCDIEYEKVFNKEGNRLNPIQVKKPPYQFFPCNFYKRRIWSPKPSDF